MKSIVLAGIFACCFSSVFCGVNTGGISKTESAAGPKLQGFVKKLSKEIKARALSTLASSGGNGNKNTKLFENATMTALTFKSQMVAGTNYFVKVKLGKYIFHVRIYRDLQENLSLSDVVGPKKVKDPIKYF